MVDPSLTVTEVLQAYPAAGNAFLSLGADCVGCYLMSFCTLHEVASQYELPLATLLQAFDRAIMGLVEAHSPIASNPQ
jgi:hypothetical protein